MNDLEKSLQLRRCSPSILWNNFHISLERIFLNLRGLMWGIVLNDSELVLSFLIQNNMKVGQKVAFRISRFKKQHFFCQQSFVNCQLFIFWAIFVIRILCWQFLNANNGLHFGKIGDTLVLIEYWYLGKIIINQAEDKKLSGCPIQVATLETFEKIHDMVPADRRLKVRKTLEAIGMSHSSVFSIFNDY